MHQTASTLRALLWEAVTREADDQRRNSSTDSRMTVSSIEGRSAPDADPINDGEPLLAECVGQIEFALSDTLVRHRFGVMNRGEYWLEPVARIKVNDIL